MSDVNLVDLGNSDYIWFEEDGVVCFLKLKKLLFIIGSVDNIYNNFCLCIVKDLYIME